jgi:hypothetical protein
VNTAVLHKSPKSLLASAAAIRHNDQFGTLWKRSADNTAPDHIGGSARGTRPLPTAWRVYVPRGIVESRAATR